MTPFKKLLDRFHNNLATDAECRQLMEMIQSGKYDEELGKEWDMNLADGLDSVTDKPVVPINDLEAIRNRMSLDDSGDRIKTKIIKKEPYAIWVFVAAAVSLLILAVGWWNNQPDSVILDPIEIAVENPDARKFVGKQFVKLPDGSTVLLNDNSELTYTSSFGDQSREVFLTGEAFFDIIHDPALPFLVRTGEINTRVLGTAFNVEAWPGESNIKITVTRGKVAVGDEDHVFQELIPNEQLEVNKLTEEFEKTTLDAEVATEWKRSFFVLDKIAMNTAAERISERFGVDVVIENEGLKNCLVNGSFVENESVEHVVSVICLAMNASYSIDGDKITIKGGIGCE